MIILLNDFNCIIIFYDYDINKFINHLCLVVVIHQEAHLANQDHAQEAIKQMISHSHCIFWFQLILTNKF